MNMKSKYLGIFRLLVCLLLMSIIGIAGADEVETVSFSAGNEHYMAELPTGYLIYTPEMGTESPLLKLTGVTPDDMNEYMELLQCVLCGVHEEKQHQLWISVKDRSDGFGGYTNEIPIETQRLFFDGVSLSRGAYQENEYEGRTYFYFKDNPSITDGGRSLYIAFFIGMNEISVRWESGNGKKTSGDIWEIQSIARSIRTVGNNEGKQSNAEAVKGGIAVTESNFFYDEGSKSGNFYAKIENRGLAPVSVCNERFAAYDKEGKLLYENSYIDTTPMFYLIEPGDSVYVSFERMWDVSNLRVDDIGRIEFNPGPGEYSMVYKKIPCEATFNWENKYNGEGIHLEATFENNTNEAIKDPQLVYAFYDRGQQLLSVGTHYISGMTIFPGSKIMIEPYINAEVEEYMNSNNKKAAEVVAWVYYEP